jgi:hypothetical protein
MKNGSGTINISFPIQNVTEYSTYYLYEISDPEIPSIVSVPTYGTLYNIDLLLQQSPIIPINVYENDNVILNGKLIAYATAPFIPNNGGLTRTQLKQGGYQFTPVVDFDGLNYFDLVNFSYVFQKTPNVDNIIVNAIGNLKTLTNSAAIQLLKKNINQPIQDAIILDSQFFGLSGNTQNFSLSITLEGSNLPIENDEICLAVVPLPGTSIDNLNVTFNIDYPTSPQSNTPDLVVTEPYFEIDFTNNDYNALFGNASAARKSQYYMDVDYSASPIVGSSLTPINFIQLIERIATKAQVQDYYYNLQRHTIPRYDGSETTAVKFNEYTNGDTGYGKEIVAGNLKPFVGYYTSKGGSTPEVLGKTIVNLDYIIDEDINTQVPALSDFTYNNQIQLFERGTNLYLDPDKNSINEQFAGINKYKIYRSGEYATPILYTQTGSNPGFINELVFTPPNTTPIGDYYNVKTSFNQTDLNLNKNSFYRLVRKITSNYYTGIQNQGYANPYDSLDNSTDNPYSNPGSYSPFFPETFPQYWNQLIFNTPSSISSNIEFVDYVSPNPSNPQGTPFKVFKFTSIEDNIQYKVKTSLTLSWNPPSYIQDNLRLQLRIVGLPASGYSFPILAGGNNIFITIAPGETKTFEIETPILSPNQNNGVFVQGRVIVSDITSELDAINFIDFATIESSNFEIIQVPEPNVTEIQYTDSTPYITQIFDENGTMTTSTTQIDFNSYPYNIPCSIISLTSSFIPAFGKIYPKVEGSGYDSTIYPFEIPYNSFSQLDLSEDYEIRFAATEELSFPIIGSLIYTDFDSEEQRFELIVARPEGYSLQSNITGDTRQSFLIRRWIPKAGYIYLEAGDPPNGLGRGIIKPEYITNGIQDKIPTIVKELTDKGLIQ